ncbi:AAA family ATPase [Amycolatopsis halotolerans]|uniref:AAA family ATPase n=1 Tax=Amycolatopsis halotolerans TaxID=330083 RepID=A0ABV7QKL6_9PSEU
MDYILSLLEIERGDGDQWYAKCPAHADNKASLSVTRRDDNRGKSRVYLDCKAGCEFGKIIYELEVSTRQMFEPIDPEKKAAPSRAQRTERSAKPEKKRAASRGKEIARYVYHGPKGEYRYAQIRFEPKDFRTEPSGVPDGDRVPYRLPQLLKGIAEGCRVWIVEGEKDVHALEALGEVATCNSGGGDNWRSRYGYGRWFKDAREIHVVRDRDETGTKFVNAVTADLLQAGVPSDRIRAWQSRTEQDHHDVSDHLGAGWTLDPSKKNPDTTGLVPFDWDAAAQQERDQRIAGRVAELRDEEEARARHQTQLAASMVPPTAVPKRRTELVRRSHEYLIKKCIPKRGTGELFGASGSYKTFVLIDAMMHIAGGLEDWHGFRVRRGRVLYIAAEGGGGFRTRMDVWLYEHGWFAPDKAAELKALDDHVLIVDEPFPILAAHELVQRLPEGWTPDLIVYDTRSNVTAGLEENSSTDMKQVSEAMRRLSAEQDATVMTVHHTGTSEEAADRGRGSQVIKDLGDFALQAEGDQDEGLRSTVFVRKFKEGERHEFGVRLVPVHLHDEDGPLFDDDGDPVTSLAVTDEQVEPGAEPKVRMRQQRQQVTQRSADEMKEQREATNAELAYRLQRFAEENPGVGTNAAAEHFALSARRTQTVRDLAVEEGLIKIENGPNNAKKMYAL